MIKYNAKIIFMMLCIGLSAHISGVDITITNETMAKELPTYDPAKIKPENKLSLNGAAAMWAEELVKQLSTEERLALAFFCLNENNNAQANEQTANEKIERIIKQIVKAEIPVDPNYTIALSERIEKKSLTSSLQHGYGYAGISQFLSWMRGPSAVVRDYAKELYWPTIDAYASEIEALDNAVKIRHAFMQGMLTAAARDIQSEEFEANIFEFFKKKPIRFIGWDQEYDTNDGKTSIKNELWKKIALIIGIEAQRKSIDISSEHGKEFDKTILKAIDNSGLKQLFDNFKTGEPAKPAKIAKEKKHQLQEDKQLVFDIKEALKKLNEQQFKALDIKVSFADTLKEYADNLTKKNILLTNDEKNELKELFNKIQTIVQRQPLTEKLKINSADLNKNQQSWIDAFVAQEKNERHPNQAHAREALLKHLDKQYPANASKQAIANIDRAINQSVGDYFDEAWGAQLVEQKQQTPQKKPAPQQQHVRQRHHAPQQRHVQQHAPQQKTTPQPLTKFIATGPQETLMVNSTHLTDENKNWIDTFIKNAKKAGNDYDATKDALLKNITTPPTRHRSGRKFILDSVGAYFDGQWAQ